MTNQATAYLTRAKVLAALSDDEIAKVSAAEGNGPLATGEEYLDLDRLDRGVGRAYGNGVQMHRVLPKSAVHAATWTKILTLLRSGDAKPPR